MLITFLKCRKITFLPYPLIIIAITLCSLTAGISTAHAIETLTIMDAIQLALENNSDLELEKQNIALSKVTVTRNKGIFYPDLSINSGASYRAEQDSSTDNYNTFDLKITSTLNVFNGLQDSSALKKAEIEFEAEINSYSRATQTCIFNIISNYTEAVSNQKLIESEAENLKDNQKQLEQIQAFYNSGKSAITDLYQQQAETKKAELRLLSAKNNFKISMLKLTKSMGIGADHTFNVNFSDVVNVKTFPDYAYDLLLNDAYKTRPDLESVEKHINAANAGISEAKGGYLPSVNLFAEVGSDYNSNYDNSLSSQLVEDGVSSAIGFNVSIPVFDRSVTKSNISEAKIGKRKYVLEQKSLKQEIQLEIGETLEEYRTAIKQLEVTEALLKYSKKVVDSTVEKYAAGSSSINDLIEARSRFANARYNHITAGYDLIREKAALAYYKGDASAMIAGFKPQIL